MNTENEFIAILAEPYWEDSVTELLEKYEIPKIEPKDDEFVFFGHTESGYIQFQFDDKCKTDKQKSMKDQGNFYVQGIVFDFDIIDKEDISAPLGIDKNSTYESIQKELGHADFQDKDRRESAPMYRKIWKLEKNDNTSYRVVCRFHSDTKKIESLNLLPHNKDTAYRVVKNELLP